MLPNKWTFSLKILVVMLALAFVAPCALAGDFTTELSIEDVSFADKSFPEYQHDNQVESNANTYVYVKFDKVVDYRGGNPGNLGEGNFDDFKDTGVFTHHDVVILIYSEIGTVLGNLTGAGIVVIEPRHQNQHDGKNYTITFNTLADNVGQIPIVGNHKSILVYIKQGGVTAVDPAVAEADRKNAEGSVAFDLVRGDGEHVEPGGTASDPYVLGISTTALRAQVGVTEPFTVKIRLSEQPKTFTTDHIDVTEGKVTEIIPLEPVEPFADDLSEYIKAVGREANAYFPPTGRRHLYYNYLVTIEPKFENKNDIVIKVKAFEDLVKSTRFDPNAPYKYTPPTSENRYVEGDNKLTVKVGKEDLKAKVAGVKFALPKEKHIPAGGYLVVAEDKGGSSVHVPPGEIKDAPKPHERTPAERMYNVIDDGDLPNLETFLANGGVIDVVSPHALIITEIMWGSDASLDDPGKSQWIELYNAGAAYKTVDGDNTTYLVFYGPGDVLPAVTTVKDRVGTVDAVNGYWSLAGKGQSGRTAEKIQGQRVDAVPTVALISMNRVMSAGTVASGTMASSWMQSVPPSSNFEANRLGTHIGSPGAMPVTFPAPPALEPAPAPAPVVPVAMASDIMISEIMVDTGDGRLPQWIELTNVSRAEKSLAGWSVQITNSEADADVIGSSVRINLSGILGIGGGEDRGGDLGKALLLVSGSARSSSNLAGSDRVVDVSIQLDQKGRYKLISDMGFMIALVPPQDTGVLVYGDTAGNLDAAEAWEIPMDENGRSSLIRRDVYGMATMGTAANSWVLASSTPLVKTPTTWYGSDEDAGTPGVIGGGPLPVELSMFYPARDKVTGAVVITWSTQSELNNAGFFIKRSQQRKGEFKVVNATMIAGAGTTSEKQSYTYTDETAQPNVVYYYQIEDVSLDGNRQTLIRGIRLKGHIGAAGKATTTWGDLKTQE